MLTRTHTPMPTAATKPTPPAYRPLWVSHTTKDLVKSASERTGVKMSRLADDILRKALAPAAKPTQCHCTR